MEEHVIPTRSASPQRTTGARGVASARLVVALLAIAALAGGGYGAWYLFLRPAAPAAVGTPSAVTSTATPSSAASESPATSSSGGSSGEVAGSWTVDPSIGSFDDFSGSFVGYRIREELAGVGAQEAVGRTPAVTGTLTVDGTTLTAAEITADLSSLQSDDDRRDGQLRRQALETEQFPSASFTLATPIDLGTLPTDGQTIHVEASGSLTLHGQTRTVTIGLDATRSGDALTVTGSLPIVLADYGIAKPSSFLVLSVAEEGTMELQLHFRHA
jgi:polyisoprenoid-binding protein YceI